MEYTKPAKNVRPGDLLIRQRWTYHPAPGQPREWAITQKVTKVRVLIYVEGQAKPYVCSPNLDMKYDDGKASVRRERDGFGSLI